MKNKELASRPDIHAISSLARVKAETKNIHHLNHDSSHKHASLRKKKKQTRRHIILARVKVLEFD